MSLPEDGAPRRKLPIGIQTFRKIREGGCYYVDKTPWVRRLVDEGEQYFLSRPGASARACCWTPSRNCSRAARNSSGDSPSTTNGTGTRASRWCGSASAAATTRTRTGWRKT